MGNFSQLSSTEIRCLTSCVPGHILLTVLLVSDEAERDLVSDSDDDVTVLPTNEGTVSAVTADVTVFAEVCDDVTVLPTNEGTVSAATADDVSVVTANEEAVFTGSEVTTLMVLFIESADLSLPVGITFSFMESCG